ncbi:hypothetical protein QA634_23770 [Methylobacterium sp. CB376]|uniref:hypothetical protein n=1 Tax=unclassified Methylobacterium TaxID=2615210 RepID=UPI0005B96928|nr:MULTISPECIES: hypothetical protein [Methylobacterium]WFT78274.1 hypothetical protein QA634_23770 [Methylobacterium nodulans]
MNCAIPNAPEREFAEVGPPRASTAEQRATRAFAPSAEAPPFASTSTACCCCFAVHQPPAHGTPPTFSTA